MCVGNRSDAGLINSFQHLFLTVYNFALALSTLLCDTTTLLCCYTTLLWGLSKPIKKLYPMTSSFPDRCLNFHALKKKKKCMAFMGKRQKRQKEDRGLIPGCPVCRTLPRQGHTFDPWL